MSGVQINDPQAPFVMFERRAEEDREATIREGRYMAKDVDYALITPHGSRDQIERIVSEWFAMLEQQCREGRFNAEWLSAYKKAYHFWKEGKDIPQEGTPVINWPVVSPAQVRNLQDMHILTVEVLANANEEVIRRLGMGGRALVQKAKDWLAQAENSGKVVQEMEALRAANAAQASAIDQLQTQLAALAAAAKSSPLQQAAAEALQEEGHPSGGISGDDLGLNDPAPTVKKL